MSYRTILVHADLSAHARSRLSVAASIARAHDAHLIGAAMTGISRFASPGTGDLARTVIAGYVDTLYAHAAQALGQFEAVAREAGVSAWEPRLVADDPEGGLVQQGRFCDLLVLSQTDPAYADPDVIRDLAEHVMLGAARPVLVVPYEREFSTVEGPALVAWDGSREAARAAAGALPLLRRASRVTVAHFSTPEPERADAQSPELLAWLERHGVKAVLEERPAAPDVADALLSLAAAQQAALIVMGGYGHTRMRELLLGGVTRRMLRKTNVPLLMAH